MVKSQRVRKTLSNNKKRPRYGALFLCSATKTYVGAKSLSAPIANRVQAAWPISVLGAVKLAGKSSNHKLRLLLCGDWRHKQAERLTCNLKHPKLFICISLRCISLLLLAFGVVLGVAVVGGKLFD